MKHFFQKYLICFLFLIAVVGMCIGTLWNARADIKALLTAQQAFDVTKTEAVLKEKLFKKNILTEISGVTQKLMGRRYVGNQEFYQDSDGIMHLKREYRSSDNLLQSTQNLGQMLSERSIPYLVCQIAERAAYGDDLYRHIDGTSLEYIEPLKSLASDIGALYLSYSDEFAEGGLTSEQIFLKTDIHFTTEAEWYIFQRIVELLERSGGLFFENKENVLNLENYQIAEYYFTGNLGTSTGKIYVGRDKFEYYLPMFPTSMHLENPSQNLTRSGEFDGVCVNGNRNLPYDYYPITDYMQWPSPYYKITNDLVADNDILVIGCSMSMRTMAYLSLVCRSVTVLDPRSFGSTDYLKKALESEYDAVIQFSSYELLVGVGGYSAETVGYDFEKQSDGTYNLRVNVKNDGTMNWSEGNNIRMHLRVNGEDSGLRAYLADGAIVKPLDEVSFLFENLVYSLTQNQICAGVLKEGHFYFDECAEIVDEEGISENLLNAEIVSHTAPATVNCTDGYSFSITVRNTGNVTWDDSKRIRLCIWQDGTDHGYRIFLLNGAQVAPGEEYTFVMGEFRMPTPGSTTLAFQMLQEGTCYFGESEPVLIRAS